MQASMPHVPTLINTILLVEDDPFFQISLRKLVDQQAPVELTWLTAASIAAATECLAQSGDTIDLILLDLNLPDSNSQQTWETIRLLASDIPVVIVSGDVECTMGETTFMVTGAQDIVIKGQECDRNLYQTFSHAVERHEASRALQQATRELADQQHLAALGILAGGVAHEFNNLNAIIMGRAELQLARLDLDMAARAAFQEILVAARNSAEVTKGLLGMVRRDEQFAPISMQQVVNDTLSIVRRSLGGDNIHLAIDLPDMPLWVNGSAGQLGQVVMNLLINAKQAMQDSISKQISITLTAQPKGKVLLTVSDTGSGMSKDVAKNIFKPFVSNRRHSRGYGLGLATVKTIIERHDGSVNCASRPGLGTTFSLLLPVTGPKESTTKVIRKPSTDRKQPKVLVVDDEEPLRALLDELFTDQGWHVTQAENGADALEFLQDHEVDAMVVDRCMPVMDGMVLLRSLLDEKGSLPPTVMYSGYVTDSESRVLADMGVLATLSKPIPLQELIKILNKAVAA